MYKVVAQSSKVNFFKAVVQTKVLNQKKQPVTCKIVLNNNKREYEPGNEVIGHVQVNYNEEFVFYGIKLILEGYIHIKYRENDRPYEKKDSILTESLYLLGECGKNKIKSKPGTNSLYTFSIAIPSSDIPGSFEGPFGKIYYHLVVLFDHGDNKLTKRALKQITINPKSDLDPDDVTITEPITFEGSYTTAVKQISHNKKRADPALRFTCYLEQGGYITGEELKFELELENPKNQYKIKCVSVALFQRIIHHGGNILKTTHTNLVSAVVPPPEMDPLDFVPPHSDNPWKGILMIPKGLMPTQNGAIEFEYFIKVNVIQKNSKDVLSGECPIRMAITRDGIDADGELEALNFYTSGVGGKGANEDGDE